MGRHCLGILLCVFILGACGSSAPASPGHSTASTSPSTAPATGQPSAQTVLPSGSGDNARFAAFRAHVSASTTVIAALLTSLPFDVSVPNVAAATKDATAIQAWATAEADWMSANPYASCYGVVYTNWDTVRVHAAKAATTALAGNYDQAEGNFATSQYKKVAELMGRAAC